MKTQKRANILGGLSAESDTEMLDRAFLESHDYRTLIETSDRPIVVGRRGTGKSALVYRLTRYWSAADRTTVIQIIPEEDQVIAMRPFVAMFGEKFNQLRAAMRIAFRYAMLLEVAVELARHYKFARVPGAEELDKHLRTWRAYHGGITGRLRQVLKLVVDPNSSAPDRIGDLARLLQVDQIQDVVAQAMESLNQEVILLVDRVDEGYEPDTTGTSLIAGVVQSAIDINMRLTHAHSILFLRDNIFRAVAESDPDYSRNIEGKFIRLHWDEYQLFNLVCKRLRIVFGIDVQRNEKVWNICTNHDLQGEEGFRKCLQLTLYRPRDLLALLNEAFYIAAREDRNQIAMKDIESTAKEISRSRLDDLRKEYSAILPSIAQLTSAFAGRSPDLSLSEASAIVEGVIGSDTHEPGVQQDLHILGRAEEAIRGLYSVGFLGVRDGPTGSFVFCHDGKSPDNAFGQGDQLLVHPCYWMALNATRSAIDGVESQEIHDEYDIEVCSATPEIRNMRLGQTMAQLDGIALGVDGAEDFEGWCLKAVRIAFAGGLRNCELHPNRNASHRRDVVCRNTGETPAWKRVLTDYGARQVVFEIKNRETLDPEDYRQVASYLSGNYGRIGFVIARGVSVDLQRGRDVDWVRTMFYEQKVLIVKLTDGFFRKLLSKLRSPQKHDAPDAAVQKVLDTYERLYLSGQPGKASGA